jgi:hypothetical protein
MSAMPEPPTPEAPDPVPPAVAAPRPQSYAFVANLARLPGDAFELAPGYVLRRATADEIAVIRETAANLFPAPRTLYMPLWDHDWPSPSGEERLLPEGQWRYFVIAFTGSPTVIYDLQAAFDLSSVELEIAFTITYPGPHGLPGHGIGWHGGRLLQAFEIAPFFPKFFLAATEDDLRQTAELRHQLERHEASLIDVKQLARALGALKALPEDSPMRFLGYFAILESLLTHSPRPSDPYESITRQVKQKIALLNNRWTPRLDYGAFGGASPETVWTRMYAYRSLLAHGGQPDFSRGELAVLGNPERALLLIRETVKAVVRYALIEPPLLVDLRDC